jgi:hypothetical protein
MSEEKSVNPSVVRLIGIVLRVIGFCSFVLFLITGAIAASSISEQGGEFEVFSAFSGLFLFAWFVCRTARCILDDMIGPRREEKPNMVGRIGQVLYWAGFIAAVFSLSVGAVELFENTNSSVVKIWAYGVGLYLAGRAARYILKGD